MGLRPSGPVGILYGLAMARPSSAPRTPAEALELLQSYGLATSFSSHDFAAACDELRRRTPTDDEPDDDAPHEDALDDDEDLEYLDVEPEDEAPASLDWPTIYVALTSLYGTKGPTPVSLADRAFALDAAAADDEEVLARVREAFAAWIGAAVPAAEDVEEMSGYVADVLFLRHGGPQLFVLSEYHPPHRDSIELYLLRERDPHEALPLEERSYPIGPDTEAAAAGIFREADAVPQAYAEHVVTCASCRAQLLERDARGQLPRVYAELAARVARS